MTVSHRQGGGGRVDRAPQGDLAQVIDLILDKGLVIDIFVKVSLVGIELVTIDARIVVASVDTYLRFAEATNRLDLHQKGGKDLGEVVSGISEGGSKGVSKGATKGVIEAGKEKFDDLRGERRSRKERSG
ncbi:gas vesicle protein GvpJ [Pseudonocardia alni]|uniref:Gas vesicle protein A n=1 Tax=Pseudonocardia alni TaxID=33907 RepID=A0AA44ZRP8_PSEA5|nr:gas vesicle protein GvpJ [Pseudonocardia alni]PKB33172.1 gas vesicle protein GvpA/GvpJ/GvpM family [Pseudonocardia alni]